MLTNIIGGAVILLFITAICIPIARENNALAQRIEGLRRGIIRQEPPAEPDEGEEIRPAA